MDANTHISGNELSQVRRFYVAVGKFKDLLGSRNTFDNSQFRYILTLHNRDVGFIECFVKSNSKDGIVNFGLVEKYRSPDYIQELFKELFSNAVLKDVTHLYISLHVIDENVESLLKSVGFQRVTDRPTLLRLKLPTDGLHISLKFSLSNASTNLNNLSNLSNSKKSTGSLK